MKRLSKTQRHRVAEIIGEAVLDAMDEVNPEEDASDFYRVAIAELVSLASHLAAHGKCPKDTFLTAVHAGIEHEEWSC